MIIMKTNIFNVKDKKDKSIVIEEEKVYKVPFLYPLILFFSRNKKLTFLTLFILSGSLMLVSVGIAFSILGGSNDYEITYINGSEQIGTITDPEIDDEDIEEELLGDVAREDGVVLLEESFLTDSGDVIYYYTDKTALMITSKGKIYRITTDKDGNYGVDRNGRLDESAIRVLVTSTTKSLSDGTIITTYSDGTAMVEYNNQTIFVRDSNNIVLNNEQSFSKVKPSGVELTKSSTSIRGGVVYKFSDGTTMVSVGEEHFIVNKNTKVDVRNGQVFYDKNNSFKMIGEKTYSDGNTIRIYSNGAATITKEDGKVIFVRNSGDLVLKKKALYEIVPNDKKANSRGIVECTNGSKVIYYNNGAAVVIYPNNDRVYVEDADSIIYNNGKNIKNNFSSSKLISVKLTNDDKKVYSFENGKSQVINKDNTSYIVNTDTLNLKDIIPEEDKPTDGGDNKPEEEIPEEDEGTTEVPINPDDFYIHEISHENDDPLDVQKTVFSIQNNTNTDKYLKITIEEISNYVEYNTVRLLPIHVEFIASIQFDRNPELDSGLISSPLTEESWTNSEGVLNYVIYNGTLKARDTATVSINLLINYENLSAEEDQNKGFIGTIKVYADEKIS